MELTLIDYSRIANRKLLIFLYTGIFTLCFVALFGGRFASSGHGLLEKFDAPGWSYWVVAILLVISFVLLIKAIFASKRGVGVLVIENTQLEINKKKKDVYPLSEIQNINVKANWSTGKIVEDKQNWMLDFDYKGRHYHYDFLMEADRKDELFRKLNIAADNYEK